MYVLKKLQKTQNYNLYSLHKKHLNTHQLFFYVCLEVNKRIFFILLLSTEVNIPQQELNMYSQRSTDLFSNYETI